jgi:hypothetical protein
MNGMLVLTWPGFPFRSGHVFCVMLDRGPNPDTSRTTLTATADGVVGINTMQMHIVVTLGFSIGLRGVTNVDSI